jgi:hypothetical protein
MGWSVTFTSPVAIVDGLEGEMMSMVISKGDKQVTTA